MGSHSRFLLAYHGLLRTGELLSLKVSHINVAKPTGPAVISLGLTKGCKRRGAAESITIHVEDVCRRLFQWKQTRPDSCSLTGTASLWRKTFSEVLKAVSLSQWDFRPYSLRRGGATHYFSLHGQMDRLLLQGRWASVRTARLYVNEGLAVLAQLQFSFSPFQANLRAQYAQSLKTSLPPFEPRAGTAQGRGRWKEGHKEQKGKQRPKNRRKTCGRLLFLTRF